MTQSAPVYKGSRCPICLWGLYDSDWCQGPNWCPNRGRSIKIPVFMTNQEAMEAISKYHQGWQPISTAPQDGTPILVYAQCLAECAGEQLEPFITVCSFHPDAGFCVCELREATHWMPLPEPPTAETE